VTILLFVKQTYGWVSDGTQYADIVDALEAAPPGAEYRTMTVRQWQQQCGGESRGGNHDHVDGRVRPRGHHAR